MGSILPWAWVPKCVNRRKLAWAQAFVLLSISWLWRSHEQLLQALAALTSSPWWTISRTPSHANPAFFKLLLTVLELGWSSSTAPSPRHCILQYPSCGKWPKNYQLKSTNHMCGQDSTSFKVGWDGWGSQRKVFSNSSLICTTQS